MNELSLEDRIRERLAALREQPDSNQLVQLAAYLRLLERWNHRINLTAIQLDGFPDRALEALIVEPIAALPFIAEHEGNWLDLGSGGGSPAIPMKVLRPELRLVMVEARSKKSAFLREVVRDLDLRGASVVAGRIEELEAPVADLLTARALRIDLKLSSALVRLLAPKGTLAVFGTSQAPDIPGLVRQASDKLPTPGHWLHRFTPTNA